MTNHQIALVANAGESSISAFALDSDHLRMLAKVTLSGSCSTLAVDAARDLVYAGVKGGPPAIVTLRLDRTSGVLTEIARAACASGLNYLELTPDGCLLLGVSYHDGRGWVWPVTDGVVDAPTSVLDFPNLHCAKTTSDGAHAYFVSLGADLIAQYDLSSEGVLTPLDPPLVAAPDGCGPRHLVLAPDDSQAYLVTEFSGEVIRFDLDADGRLCLAEAVAVIDAGAGLRHSRFGADPRAGHLIWGADIQLAEGYVLASERTAGTIASVARTPDGRLRGPANVQPTEPQPRGFAISGDGRHVLVSGELSTTVTLYALGRDGVLTQLDRAETGAGANWVRFV